MDKPLDKASSRNDIDADLSAYEYDLPPELIAQHPMGQRDQSRLLVLDRGTEEMWHERFRSLPKYLRRGDLLVLNDTRVMPVKLLGKTMTGGKIDVLLVRDIGEGRWESLVKCGRRLREGEVLDLEEGRILGRYAGKSEDGMSIVAFDVDGEVGQALKTHGRMPLPPYIGRGVEDPFLEEDRERYQTVFARRPGAIAAPTAGLHFTDELLHELKGMGVDIAYVTLHVGLGTFLPVKVDDISKHEMHSEEYEVTEETAAAVCAARQRGGRVVAVGTTSCRTLESMARNCGGKFQACGGSTNLFIRPPFEFMCTDVLITNLHLPRSTLLMLASALVGRETLLRAYEEAVRQRYRFYSYGDAMLIM